LSEYSNLKESLEFQEIYGEGVPEEGKKRLENWIEAKKRYEGKIASGTNWQQAGAETAREARKEGFTL
jgi:hypothetical protein